MQEAERSRQRPIQALNKNLNKGSAKLIHSVDSTEKNKPRLRLITKRSLEAAPKENIVESLAGFLFSKISNGINRVIRFVDVHNQADD